MFAINDYAIEARQRHNLCLTHGRNGHESHERVLAASQLIEEPHSWVLNHGSGVSGGIFLFSSGDWHFVGEILLTERRGFDV